MLAVCSHFILLALLGNVIAEPISIREPEYMEVSIAKLFTAQEQINSEEASTPDKEYNRTTTQMSKNNPKDILSSTGLLTGQPSDSSSDYNSITTLVDISSTHPSAVPVTAPKPSLGLTRGPMVLKSQEPTFSEEARKKGWQGTVLVRVIISEHGSTQQFHLAESSGFSQLDEAAIACLRGWQFSPALKEGRPVASKIVIPITFKLN
jgi:TonB family protein